MTHGVDETQVVQGLLVYVLPCSEPAQSGAHCCSPVMFILSLFIYILLIRRLLNLLQTSMWLTPATSSVCADKELFRIAYSKRCPKED